MPKYRLKPESHTALVGYLKAKPFDEVSKILPKILDESSQEFEQQDILDILNYMVNKPYFEVKSIIDTVLPLDPIPDAQPAVTPEVTSTPPETSISELKPKKAKAAKKAKKK